MAFILVSCEPARTQAVGERLDGVQGGGLPRGHGSPRLQLDLEAVQPEDLTHTLRTEVRVIAGVTNPLTCPVMRSKPASG
jgi:hypothetical protein